MSIWRMYIIEPKARGVNEKRFDMETVRVMLPVIIMLVMGFIFQKTKFISEKGIDDIKKYITLIALPVTIFHAMGIAELNKNTAKIVITMFSVLVIAMVIGFALRPLIPEPYKNYLPFLTTVFEGGMFAYPLYQNLVGADLLVNVVIVDIAGCIFGFGIYYGILALVDQKTKFSMAAMAKTAFHSPTFIGVVLGLIMNMTGLMDALIDSVVGPTYLAIKDIIVAPLTAMILLCVGYSIKIDKKLISICVKTILIRVIMMAGLCFAVLQILHSTVEDTLMLAAFLVMFISTPTFSLPGFVKNKDAAEYFAMTTSIYVVITVVGYAIIATCLPL